MYVQWGGCNPSSTDQFCLCNATDDPKKTGHLLSLDGAKERLHLFKAGLLEEGAFDPVIDGCVGVFHTASPAQFSATDPQVCPFHFTLRIFYHVFQDFRCKNRNDKFFHISGRNS